MVNIFIEESKLQKQFFFLTLLSQKQDCIIKIWSLIAFLYPIVRVVPHLTFDRNENEAARERSTMRTMDCCLTA